MTGLNSSPCPIVFPFGSESYTADRRGVKNLTVLMTRVIHHYESLHCLFLQGLSVYPSYSKHWLSGTGTSRQIVVFLFSWETLKIWGPTPPTGCPILGSVCSDTEGKLCDLFKCDHLCDNEFSELKNFCLLFISSPEMSPGWYNLSSKLVY